MNYIAAWCENGCSNFFPIRLRCCRLHTANEKQHKKPRNPVKCPPFCPIVVVDIMTSAMNFGDVMPLLYSSKGSGNGRVIAHERHKGAP